MATDERVILYPDNSDHSSNRIPELENRIGIYVLALHLAEQQMLSIGKLGLYPFPQGYYQYIGSAGKGIRSRVLRHLDRRGVKHWHLDYLMPFVTVIGIRVFYESQFSECQLAAQTAIDNEGLRFPARFGASDCRCAGHLVLHYSPPVWILK